MNRAKVFRIPVQLVALWCALWVVIGGWAGYEIWQLSVLTDAVESSGRTLDEAGRAFQSFARVPLVGESTGRFGDVVRDNADQIIRGAEQTEGAVRRLAVLLGLAIALIPTVPVAVVYRARGRPIVAES